MPASGADDVSTLVRGNRATDGRPQDRDAIADVI